VSSVFDTPQKIMIREKRKQRQQDKITTKGFGVSLRCLRFSRTNNMFNICVYLRSSVDKKISILS
jgi:hypothetical protein